MNGLTKIIDSINGFLNKVRTPFLPIPAILLVCSVFKRGGISCMMAAANVIKRQSEFGAPTGTLPDGKPNMMNALLFVNMCETMNEIRTNAVVETVIPANTMVLIGHGANSGGPITVTCTNPTEIKTYGIVR
jgi:hypothetical protein